MSLEKTIEINNLIDLYGCLLTNRQFQIMSDYFKNDYSLSEIADNLGVSKQAIKYSIDLSTKALNSYEQKLHLNEINADLKEFLNTLDNNKQKLLYKIISRIGG